MKKSKLSLGLVTSFIAAMSLAACNDDVTESNNALVTMKGYSGETIEIVTNDMYNKYRNSSDGISKFYNQILEVMIRYEFQSGKMDGRTKKSYKQIKAEAENSVQEQKDNAKKTAKSSGTKYEDEWENILDSKGVEDEEELLETFIYDLEKKEIQDWYSSDKTIKQQLVKEFIGVDGEGNKVESKVDSTLPYHIRHILMKVEDGGSNFTDSTISASQAKKIAGTISKIVDGKQNFGAIALTDSEDTSNTAYGDVGIMTTQLNGTSLGMVSEFQLGIYAYDAILSAKTNAAIEEGLGLAGTYKKEAKTVKEYYQDQITSSIVEVPYTAIKQIGEYAETETDAANYKICDGNAVLFPRNILWNKYLNHHDVFVISNAKQNVTTGTDIGTEDPDTLGSGYDTTSPEYTLAEPGKCGFRAAKEYGITTSDDMRVLTDEAGRIILGVRSTYGIHLMVMQKSIFDFNKGEGDDVSLEQYYTTEVPTSADYPKDSNGKAKLTYVNYVNTNNKSDYTERANTVKEKIKGFDSTYDYRLYETMKSELEITFNGETGKDLGTAIDEYIARQRDNNLYNHAKGMNGVWQSYIELLEAQYANRTSDRMVSEGCIIGFNADSHDDALYKEGGACYYAK